MAMIHVARDGANIGSFPREEVQEGLRTGRFLPTDMAWQEGMPDWRPLAQVVVDKPAAIPEPGPAGAGALSASLSSSSSGAAASGSGLPWEHRQELGLVKAFIDTVSMVLMRPAEAFAMMKTEGDMTSPMLFVLIGGSAGMIVSVLFQVALHSVGFMGNRQNALFGLGIAGVWTVVYVLFIPVIIIVGMFIWSGILHLCLMMIGGAKKPFETTFRVVCFSTGSTYLLSMIPLCGGMIGGLWNIVLECIGVARAHEIDTGKAVTAVLLPLIICCGGAFLCIVLMGGIGALSQMSRH